MSSEKGLFGRQTAKEKRERKRAEAAGEIYIIGPRESQCGAAGFAVKTGTRYPCRRCGNYHEAKDREFVQAFARGDGVRIDGTTTISSLNFEPGTKFVFFNGAGA